MNKNLRVNLFLLVNTEEFHEHLHIYKEHPPHELVLVSILQVKDLETFGCISLRGIGRTKALEAWDILETLEAWEASENFHEALYKKTREGFLRHPGCH